MQTTARTSASRPARNRRSFAEALEQRIAPAGVFRWNATGGGDWTFPANWSLVSGDAGAGYPDGIGDEAQFTTAITANSTITIPNSIEIVLGKLKFDDNNSYTVTSIGSGHLVMDGGFDGATVISSNGNGTAAHTVLAPIVLRSDTTFINSTNSPLTIQTSITEQGYSSVTKEGTGLVVFSGASANTYSGSTNVLNGTLLLAKNDGIPAVGTGSLGIGSLNDLTTPRVLLGANHQIPDAVFLGIGTNGKLELANHSEALDTLYLGNNAIVATGTGTISTSSIFAYANKGGTESLISGNLELSGDARIFVTNQVEPAQLEISASIKGTAGFQKIGDGTLELTTVVPQAYTGQTRIEAGTLLLSTGTSDAGIGNDVLIASGATMRVTNSYEIPDQGKITILGGNLEITQNDDCRHLVFEGGLLSIADGSWFTMRLGGSVTVNTNAAAAGAVIDGPGLFRLFDDSTQFFIGESNDDADLTINAPMAFTFASASLHKHGAGKLHLANDGTFTGGIFAVEGVISISGQQASGIGIFGGRVESTGAGAPEVGGILGLAGRLDVNQDLDSKSLNLNANTVFAPKVTFFTSKLRIEGTVSLGDATLELTPLYALPYQFGGVLIENDGADPIAGTFNGLPEGAVITTPNGNYQITYTGGDGNDVAIDPVFVEPTIINGGKAATFTDVDGDLVTVRVTKGTLTANNFTLVANGSGAQFAELELNDPSFAGASVKVTARKQGSGDGRVNMASLMANVDLASVSVAGDLSHFEIGNESTPEIAFNSLKVDSLGFTNPSANVGSSYTTRIYGDFGTVNVKGNVLGINFGVLGSGTSIRIGGSFLPGPTNGQGNLFISGDLQKLSIGGDFISGPSGLYINVNGDLGQLSIGGSVAGGSVNESGSIQVDGNCGNIRISRDLAGGTGENSGSVSVGGDLELLKIGGSILGNTGKASGAVTVGGQMKNVFVAGDLKGGSGINSGRISAGGSLDSTVIKGSLYGGAAGSGLAAEQFGSIAIGRDLAGTPLGRAVIAAKGVAAPADASAALAIASLTVARHVSQADVLAGYDGSAVAAINADAQIGKIAVRGDWAESRALAGVTSADGLFGNANDTVIPGGSANIASRIASILIGGKVRGTPTLGDSFGFVAEEIGSLSVAGKRIALDATAKDVVSFGVYGDAIAREI